MGNIVRQIFRLVWLGGCVARLRHTHTTHTQGATFLSTLPPTHLTCSIAAHTFPISNCFRKWKVGCASYFTFFVHLSRWKSIFPYCGAVSDAAPNIPLYIPMCKDNKSRSHSESDEVARLAKLQPHRSEKRRKKNTEMKYQHRPSRCVGRHSVWAPSGLVGYLYSSFQLALAT